MGRSDKARTDAEERTGARAIALMGPYLGGKTTLLEAILARTGALTRPGRRTDQTTAGDQTAEARAHDMGVELNIAAAEFLGEPFTFIDCPGSVEFLHEGAPVLAAVDAVVVVCEPDPKRVPALQVILKALEDQGVPHLLFLNKIDTFSMPVREVLPMLQPASTRQLVLRQIPIWENGIAVGFVDLALERAFIYREHAASEVVPIPGGVAARERDARFHMLEQLADYDDQLMEHLLSDMEPPRDRVFDDLVREFRDGHICPVLLGSAERGHGILRLLKALRHEVPTVDVTARRLGLADTEGAACVIKTQHAAHGGKTSIVRVLTGTFGEGETLSGLHGEARIGGIAGFAGVDPVRRQRADAGETVALARLEAVRTGEVLTRGAKSPSAAPLQGQIEPVKSVALVLEDRKDEVKLSSALQKLAEEDIGLASLHDPLTQQLVIEGQGEMHLRIAVERLRRKYQLAVRTQPRQVPYRETIRTAVTQRGRHKKQSGGHGQFGDVVIEIAPRERGSGFLFEERVVGGSVPRQFIPSVEIGVREALKRGAFGFPVEDVAVTLLDGSYHSVDSSDMAFRHAARIAMADGLARCNPVLLEPILAVTIHAPREATPRVHAMIAQRRGQILGFDQRAGWPGWDSVEARLSQAEMDELIVELRSASSGVGTFTARFEQMAELTGRLADQVLARHQDAAE